jgi:1,4-dihydroxy-2-naphthoate octaprenyltransferase
MDEEIRPLRLWYLAARPKTLWAAVAPVIIGVSLAFHDGLAHWPSALAALIGSLLIQIGANFSNDYFDFVKGADTAERIGPTRLTQAGLISPRQMKRGFILVFTLAFICGLYLIWRGGLPVLLLGLLSILFAILYTGGPFPLGYLGLGDLLVLIFFGPVAVGGTYYVQTLRLNYIVILASLSPGFIAAAILVANNLRDISTDRRAGKKTLAVRFGALFSRMEYIFLMFTAGFAPVLLYFITRRHRYSLAAMLIILFSIPTFKLIFTENEGQALNKALANTSRLLLLYSILFSIGWII